MCSCLPDDAPLYEEAELATGSAGIVSMLSMYQSETVFSIAVVSVRLGGGVVGVWKTVDGAATPPHQKEQTEMMYMSGCFSVQVE